VSSNQPDDRSHEVNSSQKIPKEIDFVGSDIPSILLEFGEKVINQVPTLIEALILMLNSPLAVPKKY
jgi:hypothetical protein